MARKKYTVSDGKLVLTLIEAENGWFHVESPMEPALITQARSIDEAFKMARDAIAALHRFRQDPNRFVKPAKKKSVRTKGSASRKATASR